MAKKKDNKNIIAGACIAAVVIIAIILAVVFAVRGGGEVNDSYFVSDGSKYVITIESDDIDSDETSPLKTHLVYAYSGDKITGLKAYYEYADAAAAKKAYDILSAAGTNDSYKSISVSGKYVILEANEAEYEGITASQVKEQVELMKSLENATDEESDSVEEEVIEEELPAESEEATVEEETIEE